MVTPLTISANNKMLSLDNPKIMGIINVNNLSFFHKNKHNNLDSAKIQIEEMITNGVDIIDIGGMSTRPGSEAIPLQEELDNIGKIIEWIRNQYPQQWISIDTYRSEVLKEAILQGVDIINDVSAGAFDKNFLSTVSNSHLPYILMHMKGKPSYMQDMTQYENIAIDLLDFFIEKTSELNALGIHQIILDPGIGFAKDINQNFEILSHIHTWKKILHLPILIGASRKGFIWKSLYTTPEDALTGTIATNTIALINKANILRVHDVKEAIQTKIIVEKYLEKGIETNEY